MKENKYHIFAVTLKDGRVIKTKTPTGKVTEKYAMINCYHWINKQNNVSDSEGVKTNDVISIKGID